MLANLQQVIPYGLGLDAWITIGVLILTVLALISEIRPPEVIMLLGAGSLVVLGVLSPAEAVVGISNEIIPAIALLCIIVRSLELNGVLEWFGKRVLARSKNYFKEQLSIILPVGFMSAFLNNTVVVLLMAPLVRRWAMKRNACPSRYLMQISFAAILGGSCTLIGSSTNLAVQALLLKESPASVFAFFEIGKVGIPLFFIGTLYMLLSAWFLPSRKDPETETRLNINSMVARFTVLPASLFDGKELGEAMEEFLRGSEVVEITRGGEKFLSPGPAFRLRANDHLLIAADLHRLAEIHGLSGLESYVDPGAQVDIANSHFSEVVLPATSLFIGKTLEEIRFRLHYGGAVLAVYRNGVPLKGMIRKTRLRAGDTLIVITDKPWSLEKASGEEFYELGMSGKLHTLNPRGAFLSIVCLTSMVLASTFGVPLLLSALAAVLILLLFRTIAPREAAKSIIWAVLLVIVCSFAFGKALVKTGLSAHFAHFILSVVGGKEVMILAGVLSVTIVLTELLSNNSAAIIMFPIAMGMLIEGGHYSVDSIKAIGAAILIGSSSGYAIPTGYQTHMIVYGPGGYTFKDFLKQGLPLDVLTFIVGIVLIPWMFPMVKT